MPSVVLMILDLRQVTLQQWKQLLKQTKITTFQPNDSKYLQEGM